MRKIFFIDVASTIRAVKSIIEYFDIHSLMRRHHQRSSRFSHETIVIRSVLISNENRHAANPNFSSQFVPNGSSSGSGSGSGAIHRTQAESRNWRTLQAFLEVKNRLWTHPNIQSGSGSGILEYRQFFFLILPVLQSLVHLFCCAQTCHSYP